MKIAVCIVMIPKFEEVFIHRTTGGLRAVPAIMNPADENALEMALSIKDSRGGEVMAISCGEDTAEGILRKSIAMGCDHGYHLADARFARSDPLATARILAEGLRKIGPELVLCGSEALNGGQTGPRLAEILGIPHLIEVKDITLGDSPKVRRIRDTKEEEVALRIPALITVLAGANTPRTPRAVQIMRAHREGVITKWNLDDLGIDSSMVGESGSSTRIVEMFQ